MNSRERFLAIIQGNRADHPPLFSEGIREVWTPKTHTGCRTTITILRKKLKNRQHPLFLRIHPGLFLSLEIEDWRSFAPALGRLIDRPAFVREDVPYENYAFYRQELQRVFAAIYQSS